MKQPGDALPDPIDSWSQHLTREVVAPLAADRTAAIAAAALSSGAVAAGAGGATVAAAAAASHTVAKVVVAVALATAIGGGIAAVTGTLPDPIQSWIADLADAIGIDLPHPEDLLPGLPTTVPDLPEITVPQVTLPEVTLPTGTPTLTIP